MKRVDSHAFTGGELPLDYKSEYRAENAVLKLLTKNLVAFQASLTLH